MAGLGAELVMGEWSWGHKRVGDAFELGPPRSHSTLAVYFRWVYFSHLGGSRQVPKRPVTLNLVLQPDLTICSMLWINWKWTCNYLVNRMIILIHYNFCVKALNCYMWSCNIYHIFCKLNLAKSHCLNTLGTSHNGVASEGPHVTGSFPGPSQISGLRGRQALYLFPSFLFTFFPL